MSTFASRNEYEWGMLDRGDLGPDPVEQFLRWYEQAVAADIEEPNAMTLATADAAGNPSARIVLLRHADARGFTFFTSYQSRKGQELEANRRAALVFYWARLERQVRVEGRVERVSDEESDAYFASRPVGSRLGAWASPQSAVVPDRETFERELETLERQFAHAAIPRPPFWGGYRVVPETIEFWQGRPSRLHDRLRYRREGEGEGEGGWIVERLAP
jgi:pyridoxamine 5'-phosphate oxidase